VASAAQRVVVDTNILFSALLRSRTRFADVLLRSEHAFYVCESVLVELFKHKEKILAASCRTRIWRGFIMCCCAG
jgi:predicted nucleic acid-binding protein